jgi:hypothetical protein
MKISFTIIEPRVMSVKAGVMSSGRPTLVPFGQVLERGIWEDMDALVVFIERLFASRTGVDGDLTSDADGMVVPRQVLTVRDYI